MDSEAEDLTEDDLEELRSPVARTIPIDASNNVTASVHVGRGSQAELDEMEAGEFSSIP